MMKQIVLASTSPRRKELLKREGVTFTATESGYDETMPDNESPRDYGIKQSQGKARTAASRHNNAIIIAADTVVMIDNKILGKPSSENHAKEMLQMLSGKTHTVITAYTIIDTATGKEITDTGEGQVTLSQLSDKQIADYIATGDPMDKAGAYGIQTMPKEFLQSFEGDYDTIIGLPVKKVMNILRNIR